MQKPAGRHPPPRTGLRPSQIQVPGMRFRRSVFQDEYIGRVRPGQGKNDERGRRVGDNLGQTVGGVYSGSVRRTIWCSVAMAPARAHHFTQFERTKRVSNSSGLRRGHLKGRTKEAAQRGHSTFLKTRMSPSMDHFLSSSVFKLSFWGTMARPGDTELGSAGEQPNKG